MISISEQAKEVLLESLRESGMGPEQGLRLKAQEGGFALEVDQPGSEDKVIRHDGSAVLIVGQEVEEVIGNVLIDLHEGAEGPQLTIQPMP